MTVSACGLKIDGLPLVCGGSWLGDDGACNCMGKLCEHQVSIEEARTRGWIRLEHIARDGVHNKVVYIGCSPDTGGATYRMPCDVSKNAVIKVHMGNIIEVSKGGKVVWPKPAKKEKGRKKQ